MRRLWFCLLLGAGGISAAEDFPGDRFVFAQGRHGASWDPYPEGWSQMAPWVRRLTSVDPWPARREVSLTDPALRDSPFLWVTGRGDPGWGDREIFDLRRYLETGGFLVIDNAEGKSRGPFDRAAQTLPARLWADAAWRPVPSTHALRRSFFLLKGPHGRQAEGEGLWGLWAGDRLVAVYLPGDLMGALMRDPLGHPLFPCEPGGESQRAESRKVFINLVVFSMTGTYKTDAVHQPFLEKKKP